MEDILSYQREIRYEDDIIIVDLRNKSFESKMGYDYEIVLGGNDDSFVGLKPIDKDDIFIDAETGEISNIVQDENDIEF